MMKWYYYITEIYIDKNSGPSTEPCGTPQPNNNKSYYYIDYETPVTKIGLKLVQYYTLLSSPCTQGTIWKLDTG